MSGIFKYFKISPYIFKLCLVYLVFLVTEKIIGFPLIFLGTGTRVPILLLWPFLGIVSFIYSKSSVATAVSVTEVS